MGESETQETEQDPHGHAARVAHEDLPAAIGFPEYIIIIEGNQHTERGKRNHGIDLLLMDQEKDAIKEVGNHTQA